MKLLNKILSWTTQAKYNHHIAAIKHNWKNQYKLLSLIVKSFEKVEILFPNLINIITKLFFLIINLRPLNFENLLIDVVKVHQNYFGQLLLNQNINQDHENNIKKWEREKKKIKTHKNEKEKKKKRRENDQFVINYHDIKNTSHYFLKNKYYSHSIKILINHCLNNYNSGNQYSLYSFQLLFYLLIETSNDIIMHSNFLQILSNNITRKPNEINFVLKNKLILQYLLNITNNLKILSLKTTISSLPILINSCSQLLSQDDSNHFIQLFGKQFNMKIRDFAKDEKSFTNEHFLEFSQILSFVAIITNRAPSWKVLLIAWYPDIVSNLKTILNFVLIKETNTNKAIIKTIKLLEG